MTSPPFRQFDSALISLIVHSVFDFMTQSLYCNFVMPIAFTLFIVQLELFTTWRRQDKLPCLTAQSPLIQTPTILQLALSERDVAAIAAMLNENALGKNAGVFALFNNEPVQQAQSRR